MSLTSSGVALYSMLRIMAFWQTDLPEPVVPAISRCGIFLRSATMQSPPTFLPRPTEILDFAFWNSLDSRTSRSSTGLDLSLEISMPTAALPGIGASIRRDFALRLRAKSSCRDTMREILTPGAGLTSNRVTVGPLIMFSTVADTPKDASVSSRTRASSWMAAPSFDSFCAAGLFSRSSGGSL